MECDSQSPPYLRWSVTDLASPCLFKIAHFCTQIGAIHRIRFSDGRHGRLPEVSVMPREARLFTSSAGSVVRGYLKFRANLPPRWIRNARRSRKRIEPEIAEGFRSLKRLRIGRPRARVAIRNAQSELRLILDRWETACRTENFYRLGAVGPELPNQQRPHATRSCPGSRGGRLNRLVRCDFTDARPVPAPPPAVAAES
jgi:hypothetical protein